MCQRDKGFFSIKETVTFNFNKTLYDHKTLEISASTRRTLRELREQGQLVALTTGEDMSTHYPRLFLDLVNADARMEQNGAKMITDDEVLSEHFIDRALLRCMLDYTEETGIDFGVTIEDEDYCINPERICEAGMQRWEQCDRQFKDAWAPLDKKICMVSFIDTEEEARAMEWTSPVLQLRMFSVDYGVDAVEKGISKAKGLRRLCAYYSLEMHDVYVFDDSFNDSETFEEAGVDIVMGNMKGESRTIADYVTSPIGEGGIWNACKHFQLA